MHPTTDYTKYAQGYPSAPMSIPPAQLYPPFAVHVPTPTPNTSGKWSTNLCHCFDDPVNCLVTCICPCVTFGQIAEIISQGETCKLMLKSNCALYLSQCSFSDHLNWLCSSLFG